jgi:hypothetical protein
MDIVGPVNAIIALGPVGGGDETDGFIVADHLGRYA